MDATRRRGARGSGLAPCSRGTADGHDGRPARFRARGATQGSCTAKIRSAALMNAPASLPPPAPAAAPGLRGNCPLARMTTGAHDQNRPSARGRTQGSRPQRGVVWKWRRHHARPGSVSARPELRPCRRRDEDLRGREIGRPGWRPGGCERRRGCAIGPQRPAIPAMTVWPARQGPPALEATDAEATVKTGRHPLPEAVAHGNLRRRRQREEEEGNGKRGAHRPGRLRAAW